MTRAEGLSSTLVSPVPWDIVPQLHSGENYTKITKLLLWLQGHEGTDSSSPLPCLLGPVLGGFQLNKARLTLPDGPASSRNLGWSPLRCSGSCRDLLSRLHEVVSRQQSLLLTTLPFLAHQPGFYWMYSPLLAGRGHLAAAMGHFQRALKSWSCLSTSNGSNCSASTSAVPPAAARARLETEELQSQRWKRGSEMPRTISTTMP